MIGTNFGENVVIGFLGMKGTGKTTFMKHYICQEIKKQREVYIFFPWQYLDSKRNFAVKNMLTAPPSIRRDIVKKIRDTIADEKRTSPLTIVIDEITLLTKDNKASEILSQIVDFSRNYNTNILYTAKRTAIIPKMIVSQTDIFYIFRNTLKNDLEILKKISYELYYLAPRLKDQYSVEIEHNQPKHILYSKFDVGELDECLKKYLYSNNNSDSLSENISEDIDFNEKEFKFVKEREENFWRNFSF